MENGKFVYKNKTCMKKIHDFYDKTLSELNVPYKESYFGTSFGRTHCLLVGDTNKPKICTIHGGNGITTLNLKLFLPLLSKYCIQGYILPCQHSFHESKTNIQWSDSYNEDQLQASSFGKSYVKDMQTNYPFL